MWWDEVVAFVRGTRPRPPPGPPRPLATWLLVLASLLHMPLVYVLVRDGPVPPALVLGVGLLSMGLAWSGGVALEGRRMGTVRVFAVLGILQAALLLVPLVVGTVGAYRSLFLVIAALCAGALVTVRVPARA